MKKNLLSGFILLLPITITLLVIGFVVDLLTNPFLGYMQQTLEFFGRTFFLDLSYHHTLLIILSRITILILLFLFVLILGFLANLILFHWVMKWTHNLMLRIPLINSIYRICKDIISALLSQDRKILSRVVVAPFPCKESKTLGFVTGNAPHEVQNKNEEIHSDRQLKTVFVATSPHPTSGFLLFVEEQHLKPLNISLEDAFKFLISCGVFTPNHGNPEQPRPADPTLTTDPQK